MSEQWWLPHPAPTLGQGDVVDGLPLCMPVHPAVSLDATKLKGNRDGYATCSPWKKDHNGSSWILSKGKLMTGMIVSHGCDIDKGVEKADPLLLIAAVRSAAGLPTKARDSIFGQRSRHAMPLPAVPTLGDCYADLRSINVLDRDAVLSGSRIASLSNLGRSRLRAQLVTFFTRIELSQLEGFLGDHDTDTDP